MQLYNRTDDNAYLQGGELSIYFFNMDGAAD